MQTFMNDLDCSKPLDNLLDQFVEAIAKKLVVKIDIETLDTICIHFHEHTPIQIKHRLLKHIQNTYDIYVVIIDSKMVLRNHRLALKWVDATNKAYFRCVQNINP